jgi:tetratricopeptide (TPR) repeat protein
MKLVWICLLLGIMSCSQNQLPLSVEQQRKFARQLLDKGLYTQAVEAFNDLAEKGSLSSTEKAGAYYYAANICFENIRDYERAVSYYMKSELCGAQGQMATQLKSRIIECLERLGKSYDAQKELDKRTLTEKEKPLVGETIIALIGKRQITMDALNDALRMLPEYMQKEYTTNEKKLEFLKHYLATELLYDSALRKGFDRNSDITKSAEQMKKNLMVEALLSEELEPKISVTETEIKLYYQANKDTFKGKSLDEVRNQIAVFVGNDKKQQAYTELMNRLMTAEKVIIYEEYFPKDSASQSSNK